MKVFRPEQKLEIIRNFINRLTNQGADPNYSWKIKMGNMYAWYSVLGQLVTEANNLGGNEEAMAAVRLVLDRGANPYARYGIKEENLIDNLQKSIKIRQNNVVKKLLDLLTGYADKYTQ